MAQGPFLEVLAELQDAEVQDFAKFEQMAHARFALTLEMARISFREEAKDQKDACNCIVECSGSWTGGLKAHKSPPLINGNI